MTRTPRRLPSRTSSTERAVEMCWMCSRPPVISARRMSRATMMSSAAAGMPPRPSRIDSNPSFITPPTVSSGTWQCCMITRSNILAYCERPAHQRGRGDRRPVVGEGDRAAGDELAELGQLLPLASLADGADGIDVGLPRPLGLEDDELGGRLGVDRRACVLGMQATEVTPPARAALGAGGDRLVLLVARLAEVDVDVDQARADDHAPGVDDDLGLLVAPARSAGSGPG